MKFNADIGISLAVLLIVLIFSAAMFSNGCVKETENNSERVREYFFRKYGIDILDSKSIEDIEYEVIIDAKTGKRTIREKKPTDKSEASNGYLPSYIVPSGECAFC